MVDEKVDRICVRMSDLEWHEIKLQLRNPGQWSQLCRHPPTMIHNSCMFGIIALLVIFQIKS